MLDTTTAAVNDPSTAQAARASAWARLAMCDDLVVGHVQVQAAPEDFQPAPMGCAR
jgi:hypothetical protein